MCGQVKIVFDWRVLFRRVLSYDVFIILEKFIDSMLRTIKTPIPSIPDEIPEVKKKPAEASSERPIREEVMALIEKCYGENRKDAVITLFDHLMNFAHSVRASDIHLEPWKDHGVIRIRIDGILHDEFEVQFPLHVQLIARLKILTRMRTDEHHAPQDGRFKYTNPSGDVDVRVSVLPTEFGEKAVLRLLSSQSHKLSLEQLGFSPEDLARVQRAIRKPWGMLLATGPTGSGKTTTVYAILEVINQREVNISTIEDPVEFEIPGINQSQVDRVAKLTFATGLRSLLRQDPDILMVGEIRDQETAKIAVNAAMTGHKLLSTLHTNDAATTIPRMIDMGVEPFLMASTLICAIAQRLVRRVCPDCSQKKQIEKKDFQEVFGPEVLAALFEKGDSVTVAQVGTCDACSGTGYRGRIGIYEVLENSPTIQEKILTHASSADIEALARKEGMTSIALDGVRKVLSLETTIEELIRVMQE